MSKVRKAELKIAAILQELEKETGEVVEYLGLDSMEITRIEDVSRQFRQRVQITMHRLPGNDWEAV